MTVQQKFRVLSKVQQILLFVVCVYVYVYMHTCNPPKIIFSDSPEDQKGNDKP